MIGPRFRSENICCEIIRSFGKKNISSASSAHVTMKTEATMLILSDNDFYDIFIHGMRGHDIHYQYSIEVIYENQKTP